jgi:5-methylthioadenosine/S-adenosylhomocysteine deaminase
MILIKNIALVTQNHKRQIIREGALVIENDLIKDLGRTKNIEKKYSPWVKKVIDGQGKVALPGLINAHGHLAMTLLRGYADDLPLEKWWADCVYPIESKFTRREVFCGSLLAMAEMIESGTTCFADFYYYSDEVGRAAQEIGIRGTLGCAVLDLPTFEFKNTAEALGIAQLVIKKFKNNSLLAVFLAPHMFQTTGLITYKKSKELAKEYDLVLSTHTAETKQEIDYCLKKYGRRPIEILDKGGILDKNTLLAHCCWLTKREIKILAKSGASVVHCPVSNMKLASGIMPLKELLAAGVNVSLGTDSACSNNNLDMFEEIKTAALLHKVRQLDPTVADAQTILDMATINGAQALGLRDKIGSLEPGKKADVILVDFEKPHLIPCHNIVSHLVYSTKGSDVETVIINGKIVMEKRKIKGLDKKELFQQVSKLALFKKR